MHTRHAEHAALPGAFALAFALQRIDEGDSAVSNMHGRAYYACTGQPRERAIVLVLGPAVEALLTDHADQLRKQGQVAEKERGGGSEGALPRIHIPALFPW